MEQLPVNFELPKVNNENIEISEKWYSLYYCIHALLKYIDNFDNSSTWLIGYEDDSYYAGWKTRQISEVMNTISNFGVIDNNKVTKNLLLREAIELINSDKDFYLNEASKNKRYNTIQINNYLYNIKNSIYKNNLPLILHIRLNINDLEVDNNNIIISEQEWSPTNLSTAVICYGWTKDGLLIQPMNGIDKKYILPYYYKIEDIWAITLKED